jgi:hypothetical protein
MIIDNKISISMPDKADRERIKKMAHLRGMTVSQYVRWFAEQDEKYISAGILNAREWNLSKTNEAQHENDWLRPQGKVLGTLLHRDHRHYFDWGAVRLGWWGWRWLSIGSYHPMKDRYPDELPPLDDLPEYDVELDTSDEVEAWYWCELMDNAPGWSTEGKAKGEGGDKKQK